jgi:hypothetical protein
MTAEPQQKHNRQQWTELELQFEPWPERQDGIEKLDGLEAHKHKY